MSDDLQATIRDLENQLQALESSTQPDQIERIILLNTIGNTYHQLSQQVNQKANLQHATISLKNALRVCDPRQFPDMYAVLNVNLGNIYVELSELEDTYANLLKALDAYQETLLNTNPNKPDATYATMQNNVGNVCRRLANFEDRALNLQRALTAYQEAATVFTRQTAPLAYATLQANLGIVQSELGDTARAADAWLEAADIAALAGATEEADYFYELAKQAQAKGDSDAR